MGKNKNTSHKQGKQAPAKKEAQSQQQEQQQQPPAEVALQTPEEKTQQYKEMQLAVFNNFLKDFQEDEKQLMQEPSFVEKERDIEKREREEIKRLEKQVYKKEQQDVEEAYANGNLKLLRDRIYRSIVDGVLKQEKVLARSQAQFNESEAAANKKRQEVQSALNKKQLLSNLCHNLLEKNCELYLKHEKMLEEERVARSNLAGNFGEQMKEVQDELDVQKKKRQDEITENTELRTQIQKAINEYKAKEADYRAKMDAHGKTISEIEKKLKSTIDSTVTKTIKEAETEKAQFLEVSEKVKELSTKINSYMQKFDQIKEEMADNSKKFEAYQEQVETKKLEIKTLETEIENIQLFEKREQKVTTEIVEERKRVTTQVEALRNLSKALKDQLKNLQSSDSQQQSST